MFETPVAFLSTELRRRRRRHYSTTTITLQSRRHCLVVPLLVQLSTTDVIVKDSRDTYYGQKICLTGGASNLILDCVILEGNPADTELVEQMLDRQQQIYGRYPLKVALDGGFASKDNLLKAKARKIKDVCFAKKRGLEETDMCRSEYVYKKLRCFRAGIEAGISWLKRSFGLTRCTWKGFRSFKSYVLSSVVAANLLTMARKKLAAV